jgi:hypothetical protein
MAQVADRRQRLLEFRLELTDSVFLTGHQLDSASPARDPVGTWGIVGFAKRQSTNGTATIRHARRVRRPSHERIY